jgi:uncharacterized membrane-anchored protein YjiN (DUF445 family)
MNEVEFKQKRLKKLKRIATAMFFGMVVLFILARWLSYYYYKELWQAIAAFAEAGMVGALADWYAVTALFKHPMGIKIPHTNLIAIKKDKFAVKMGDFIQQHFLKKEAISQKVADFHISQKLGEWLENEKNQQKIIAQIQNFIPEYIHQLNEHELNHKLQQHLINFILKPETEAYFYLLLEKLTQEKHHHKLLEIALEAVITQIDDVENRKKIHSKVKEESPSLLPKFIGKIYTDKFLEAIKDLATTIKNDPEHEIRFKFDRAIQEWAEKSKTEPQYQEKIHNFKQKIIQENIFQENTHELWTKFKTWLINELNTPATQTILQQQLRQLSQKLTQDFSFSKKTEEWIQTQIIQVIENNQETVKKHITSTIKGWDSAFLANQLELEVGKDLQYIRINGTLVGGLIGLMLYMLTEFIPQWLRQ